MRNTTKKFLSTLCCKSPWTAMESLSYHHAFDQITFAVAEFGHLIFFELLRDALILFLDFYLLAHLLQFLILMPYSFCL